MKKLHPYFRKILEHILIWIAAFFLFYFLREYGHDLNNSVFEPLTLVERIRFQILLGALAGVMFGSYAYVLERYLDRRFSFGIITLIRSVGYIVSILSLVLFGFILFRTFFESSAGLEELQNFFSRGNHLVLIVYCFIVGFLIEFFQEMDRKFGPGNLWRMIKGTYFHPMEEERVFMFLDMRSSTTIAEKLGHIQYSLLVQDCFKDIVVVSEHAAEIYQYVGDEAVLTWNAKDGFLNNNCVNAFLAFKSRLQERGSHYHANYGLIPEFKAGVNVGIVTVAEVGDLKREIAFHGDTINTAARIQSKCNELGHDFLASKWVVERLEDPSDLEINLVGEVMLKGKNSKLSLLSIEGYEKEIVRGSASISSSAPN